VSRWQKGIRIVGGMRGGGHLVFPLSFFFLLLTPVDLRLQQSLIQITLAIIRATDKQFSTDWTLQSSVFNCNGVHNKTRNSTPELRCFLLYTFHPKWISDH
jgi:hypothetical protein